MTAWEAIREAPRRISAAVESSRPALRGIASPPRRLSGVPFAVVVVTLLAIGMIGLLLLTTFLQNQAFEVRKAQAEASVLGYRVSDLEAQVTRAQSPARLAAEATQLGMVPNPNGVYIDLGTGQIVGEGTPVRGDELPSLQVHEMPTIAPAFGSAPPTTGASASPAPDAASATPAPGASAPLDGDPGAFAPPVEGAAAQQTMAPAARAASIGGTP